MDSFKDYAAIRQAINLYIEAGKQAKSEIMKPVFHQDAIMYGTSGAEVSGGPIRNLFEHLDANPKAAGLNAEITAIEVVKNIAYVRVESDNWNGARCSDMFLLLREASRSGETGAWKIITKIFFDHK